MSVKTFTVLVTVEEFQVHRPVTAEQLALGISRALEEGSPHLGGLQAFASATVDAFEGDVLEYPGAARSSNPAFQKPRDERIAAKKLHRELREGK